MNCVRCHQPGAVHFRYGPMHVNCWKRGPFGIRWAQAPKGSFYPHRMSTTHGESKKGPR